MPQKIKLGISTCPNDTFAFHAILKRRIDMAGLEFDVDLLDVQELNRRLAEGVYEIAKASFHAALLMADKTVVLSSGSALGFGVGPVLLSRHQTTPQQFSEQHRLPPIVLCPGESTTATLLYKLFYPSLGQLRQVVFSEIIPALQENQADFGVCIHEGRFTWQDSGLQLVVDLGDVWEKTTGMPLPLGGILASRNLDVDTVRQVQLLIRESIEYGLAHREETLPTMRHYAQEFRDDVLFAHVDLYVNQQTIDLGPTGRAALERLHQMAIGAGVISEQACGLQVFAG